MAAVKKTSKKETKPVTKAKTNNIEEACMASENVETTILEPETPEEPVEGENANYIEDVKEAINNVDTTILEPETPEEPVEGENEVLAKAEAHIEEMGKEMENLQNRQQTLQKELENNPDNAEKLLKEELAKAKEAFKKITYSNAYYTNIWNGQSCY